MLGAELEVGLAYEVVVKGAMVGMGHLQRTCVSRRTRIVCEF
jgi:hypothetical protein